jgi:AhpD family alkylhydroperoxidase
MPRLAVVDPAQSTGKVKEIFEGPLKGKHINIFKGMANSPAVLQAYLGMAGALAGAKLSAKEQEIVQLAIGAANDCGYCQAAHTVIGKGAGLSEQQTVAARGGASLGDAKLDALKRFALAMHEKRGNIGDAELEAFRKAGYDDGHAAEVTAVYALATFTNYFNHLNDTAIDFPAPPAV